MSLTNTFCVLLTSITRGVEMFCPLLTHFLYKGLLFSHPRQLGGAPHVGGYINMHKSAKP